MRFYIKPKTPFNFDLTAGLYSRFPTQCVDLYYNGVYKRVLKIGNRNVLVKVSSAGSIRKPKLVVECGSDVSGKEFIREKVKWMFGTDDDVGKFYNLALKDKGFSRVVRYLYGLRAPKTPTVFEALIIAITEQQIALPIALAVRKRLIEKYGSPVNVGGGKYYTFPTPEQLAKAKPEDIRQLKFSFRKSEYIINVSRKVADGKVDLEAMKNWEMEKISETLTKIRGIGPWTVEYMMCRGMGRYDSLPAGDMGLRIAVTEHLGREERVSEGEVRELFKPFGRYRGYAAFYLIYFYAPRKSPLEKQLDISSL